MKSSTMSPQSSTVNPMKNDNTQIKRYRTYVCVCMCERKRDGDRHGREVQ